MTCRVRDTDSGTAPRPHRPPPVHPQDWRELAFAGNFPSMDVSPATDLPGSTHLPDFGIPPRLACRMSMAEQYEYLRTMLVRRRTLVTAGAVAAGAVAAGGLLTGCGGGSGTRGATPTPTATATA